MTINQNVQSAIEQDYKEHLEREAGISRDFLLRNATLNLMFRGILYLACTILFGLLIWYVYTHADPMANVLLGVDSSVDTSTAAYWQALGAVLIPVGALLVLLALIIMLALVIQSRGIADFERLMEGVSRIRRDSIGVARTRSVSFAVEEVLHKARRSFTLQLWLGRSLFAASVVLIFAFVIYSMVTGSIDAVSITLGAGSILSFAVSSITNQADKVAVALANVTQLQLTTMATAERVGVLSEYAYSLLEQVKSGSRELGELERVMTKVSSDLGEVAREGVSQIQQYAEPGGASSENGLPPPPPNTATSDPSRE